MSLHIEADFGPGAEYSNAMDFLRLLGKIQGELAYKAGRYAREHSPLADRFQRASFAAMNARLFIQAALMAERETPHDALSSPRGISFLDERA